MKESELYPPLKKYLEAQGYSVHGEVKTCDLVARRGEELIVVELKSSLSLALLSQAVERKELTDSVYIAIPIPEGRRSLRNFRKTKNLLRHLEIGCILIDLMKTKRRIEIALHPYPFTQKRSHKKRRALLREIDGRYAEFDLAGQASTVERITAYKQQALYIACLLQQKGPLSPRSLRSLGASDKCQTILSSNTYGWFERERRGIYILSEAGTEALNNYREVVSKICSPLNSPGESK